MPLRLPMPRLAALLCARLPHHLTQRGNRRAAIMRSTAMSRPSAAVRRAARCGPIARWPTMSISAWCPRPRTGLRLRSAKRTAAIPASSTRACASPGYVLHPPLQGYGMQESDSIGIANLIQGLGVHLAGGFAMSFGDIRVAQRADWLVDRIAALGTLVLRRIGETRAGEMAVHGFLSSPYVSVAGIVETVAARTAAQCAGRRILAMQDTTEINFAGREKKRRGFGPAGNGKTAGFFIHPVIAVDVETEAVIGLVDAAIWTRSGKCKLARQQRAFAEKELARWHAGCEAAAAILCEASSVTMVSDRESDIYPLFARQARGSRSDRARRAESQLGRWRPAVRGARRSRVFGNQRSARGAARAGRQRHASPGSSCAPVRCASPARRTVVWTTSPTDRAHPGGSARGRRAEGQERAALAPAHHLHGHQRRASR